MDLFKDNAIQKLNDTIGVVAENIHDYTESDNVFVRNRKLNAYKAIHTTLNMQGNSLKAELLEAFPDYNERMTASAYEQAKDKLTPEVFMDLLRMYNATASPIQKLLDGKFRVYAGDGCVFNTPLNPDSIYFMNAQSDRKKKDGEPVKPFCQMHASLIYNLETRTYEDCIVQPKSRANERDAMLEMIKRIDNSTPFIIILDRGYFSFNMIENLNRIPNCYYIIRTNAKKGAVREIKALADKDYDNEMVFDVTWSTQYYQQNKAANKHLHLIQHAKKRHKTTFSKNTRDRRWDFDDVVVTHVKTRVVKFRINDDNRNAESWEVLVTNLNRVEFPRSRLKSMYHGRWHIETSFRALKYEVGAIAFHSKKDKFLVMELFAHLVMYNATSRNIANINVPQANHKHPYAVDFKMACLLTRKYFRLHCKAPPEDILTEIQGYINPVREGRKDKRKTVRPKTAVWFVYRVA